jgi:acyl-coenzyme A thioesterase PaaI-like protein
VTIDIERVQQLRDRYGNCFGCGMDNPLGLHLDGFVHRDGAVEAPFTPRPEYAGFDDTLHGGVVATALDEISAWAAMIDHSVLVFTAKLEIRYRKQAKASRNFILRGHVADRRGKRLIINASLIDGEEVVAQSEGLFLIADELTADLVGGAA